jgi:hypothetical protein
LDGEKQNNNNNTNNNNNNNNTPGGSTPASAVPLAASGLPAPPGVGKVNYSATNPSQFGGKRDR